MRHVNIIGSFDMISDGCALGWACDSAQSSPCLTIEIIRDDGEVVARGAADRFREDLLAAGLGNGCCHFALTLSSELFDGQSHSLSAQEMKTQKRLEGGPHIFGPVAKAVQFDELTRQCGLQLLDVLLQQPAFIRHRHQAQDIAEIYRRASLLQETGQFADARKAYSALLDIIGNNPLLRCKIGETYLLEATYESALEAYQAAIDIDCEFPWAYLGVGHALRFLGRASEAKATYRKALELQPSNKVAIQAWIVDTEPRALVRADALIAQGETDAAIELLKQQMIENPNRSEVVDKLGQLLMQKTPPAYDTDLPTMNELQDFQKAQRLLELVLADAEARLSERVQ